MRTKTQIHKMALLSGAMALSFAFAVLAGPRAAQAVDVCEEDIVYVPPNSTLTLTPTPSVTNPIHVVTIAGAASNEKVTADCVTEDGSSIEIYDASCAITVNGVTTTMNPCITSASTFSVVALDDSCTTLTQDVPALTSSIPGIGATVTTSGPFAGCTTYGSVFPWSSLSGLFILGGGQTSQVAAAAGITGTCPTVGAGGIGRCTSYPQ